MSLDSYMAIDTTRRRWQNRRVWRKNSAVQAPDNIIMNILSWIRSSQSWKSSTHDRASVPDSYHRYSNSDKLLTTDICTRVSARDSNYSDNKTTPCAQHAVSCAARAHPVTWRTSRVSNRTSRPWQSRQQFLLTNYCSSACCNHIAITINIPIYDLHGCRCGVVSSPKRVDDNQNIMPSMSVFSNSYIQPH